MPLIKEIFKENRPREKAIKYGVNNLSEVELLTLIISSGVKNHSALDIANDLLNKYKTINNLSNISYEELSLTKGLSKAKTLSILACFELFKRIQGENKKLVKKDYKPYLISQEFNYLTNDNQEYLYCLLYRNSIRIKILKSNYHDGIHTYLNVNYLIEECKKVAANRLILIHNHITESILPSNDDIMTTIELAKELIDHKILLFDHLIISRNEYFSFLEQKLL